MKIIKGDDSKKQIDNIVQQQLKVESATDTTSSKTSSIFGSHKKTESNPSTHKPQSTTSTSNSTTTSNAEPEKKTFFGNLFGSGAGSKHASNKSTQQPKPEQIEKLKTEPIKPTSNPLQQPQNSQKTKNKGLDINFKFDPTSNKVKDVNVSGQMDYDTAKTIYDNNKQYLPTGAQVMSGMKTGYNVGSKVLAENEGAFNQGTQPPQKKTEFF